MTDTKPSPGFRERHIKLSRGMERIADAIVARIGQLIGQREAKQVSFSLFLWHNDSDGEGGHASYIGTCEREQMIPVLEAMIARWKAGDPQPPLHKVN
jgi:hypothetical protein